MTQVTITDPNELNHIKFSELKSRTVFRHRLSGELLVKLAHPITQFGEPACNAFSLKEFKHLTISKNAIVDPISEITISYKMESK